MEDVDYCRCQDCGRLVRRDNCVEVLGMVCPDCFKNYVECELCGRYLVKEVETLQLIGKGGKCITVCEHCFDHKGAKCQNCGQRCLIDALDADGCCPDCADE